MENIVREYLEETEQANDLSLLLDLKDKLLSLLEIAELINTAKIEFDCIPVVAQMEMNGMLINKTRFNNLQGNLVQERDTIASNLRKHIDPAVNLNNNNELLNTLKSIGIPLNSTSNVELLKYADKYLFLNNLRQYRKIVKVLEKLSTLSQHINSTTERIHPKFNQLGTTTGRFSCANPPLQQVPRNNECRKCFISPDNYKLIIADYSQVELRIIAHISNDQTMIQVYRKGNDLHTLTSSLITGKPIQDITENERQMAKAVNFGLVYAMGAKGLQNYAQNNYGVEMTIEEATKFRKRFFDNYKGIFLWHQSLMHSDSHETRTLNGRRRVWQDNEDIKVSEFSNTPVQGTGADILKKALILLPETLDGTDAKIINVIHDEIILETPNDNVELVAKIVHKVMKKAWEEFIPQLPIEIDVRISNTWAKTVTPSTNESISLPKAGARKSKPFIAPFGKPEPVKVTGNPFPPQFRDPKPIEVTGTPSISFGQRDITDDISPVPFVSCKDCSHNTSEEFQYGELCDVYGHDIVNFDPFECVTFEPRII